MEASDITIKAEDVQAAVNANPAIDLALKEQALLRRITELESKCKNNDCKCDNNDDDVLEESLDTKGTKDA